MKKICIILVVFLIVLSGIKTENDFTLLDYFSGEYTAYTSENETKDSIYLGFCYVNSKPVKENLIGESIVVENLEVASAINSLKARVVKTEYLQNGTTVIYAYTSLIGDSVKVEGKAVNLQFALRDETTVVGWPLILGSY